MCGRVAQYREVTTYAAALGADPAAGLPNAAPHYNGAPSQDLLVLRREPRSGERRLGLLRWGLLPHWASNPKLAWKLINARAESLATAPAFRDAYRARRCLVPIDGFYEWKRVGTRKQPFLIAMKSGEPFTLGGLWENWKDPRSGEWVRTFTVVTTPANSLVGQLHNRMPLIIAPADRDRWLAESLPPADLLVPFPSELMAMWPVSAEVNSPKNDGAGLILPVPLPAEFAFDNAEPDPVPGVNEGGLLPANSE